MSMITWIKKNGSEIKTNDEAGTIEEAIMLGWKTPKQIKAEEKAKKEDEAKKKAEEDAKIEADKKKE